MLGIAVSVCFLTGLLSHLHQHPVSWLPLPPSPSWGYQVTQGAHVAFGIGCIPLVLVKLFSVYPLLLQWPPVRGLKHGLERLSVAVLVSCMLFEVSTGMLNTVQWYPWRFFFPAAHYAVAWALVGSIMLHLAVKADVIRDALRARLDDQRDVPDASYGLSRRGLLLTTVGAVGAVTLVTIGQTLPGLGGIALLAPRRPDIGPQGLPVNRTATAAAVRPPASAESWRLEVGPEPTRLSRSELEAMAQHEVSLPIACVEGWSSTGHWGGVRLRDVLSLAGIDAHADVRVRSLEPHGIYRSSELTAAQAAHPDTLLALRLNGSDLSLDHGFPLRLIAPNRPGVLQTKWLARIEVA